MAGTRNRRDRGKKPEKRLSAKGRIKDEVIIDVQDVYKSFRVYFDKGSMLKEAFVNPGRSRYENREILKGISFRIRRGETVALIGQNGCGKSTTLKMLTKILYPNSGTVTVDGKVSSLIELGAGFHPDMSGRENIYINASILGIKEKEVEKRIDEIIRFSELEDYIDNPIRTYSSGMYMRLAFSVAINVDADILLIDEILAVGDQGFQEKCINKLDELRKSGVTVVLVSHAMGQVKAIADRCIWIDDGQIRMDGETDKVCKAYEVAMEKRRTQRDAAEDEQRQEAGRIKDNLLEASAEAEQHEEPINNVRIKKKISRSARWAGSGTGGFSLAVCMGMLLMVLGYAMQDIYGTAAHDIAKMTLNMKLSGFTLLAGGRAGTPILLVCMGFVFSGRRYVSKKEILDFYFRVFVPFLVMWEIWLAFYQGFLYVFEGERVSCAAWFRQAVFMEYPDLSHAWFMRIFFALLLLMPILANILQRISMYALRLVLIISWFIIFLMPGLDLYGQANGGTAVFRSSQGILCYLFYLCMGYFFSRYNKRLLRGSREVLIGIAALIGTVFSQMFLDARGIGYLVWCTYYLVSVMALVGFDLTIRMKLCKNLQKIADFGCAMAPGVFFVHRPVEMILARSLFSRIPGLFCIRTLLLWVCTSLISAALAYLISCIPVAGEILTGVRHMKAAIDKT